MNRLFSRLLIIFFTGIFSCNSTQTNSVSETHPNIIFIMADDLGYGDVGVYGQKMIATPNIDKLAREGMMFTQFYAGSTVCAPSRSAIMTGLHTGHTPVRGNADVPLKPADVTVAELIKNAGYTTGLVGKWGLGEAETSGIPNKQGFDYFYGYLNQVHAHNYYPSYLWENTSENSLANEVSFMPEGYAKGVGGYATERKEYAPDKFLDKTLQFLEKNKDSTFFLYLPFTIPHANDEAGYFKQSGMEVPDLGMYKDKDWPYDQKAHAAMITYLDTQVGVIMNKLKALRLDENTLVIFTSDNGPHNEGGANSEFFKSSGPLRGSKRDLYEGGIRVPFIAWWPGKIKANGKSDYAGAFWDVLPTFCELAGEKIPNDIDGISFLPALLGQPQPKHDYLYWEFFEQGGKQAVRFDNWKCLRLNVNSADKTQTELFNLEADIGEKNNIALKHPDIVDKAIKLMNEAHVYSPDFHFTNEQVQ